MPPKRRPVFRLPAYRDILNEKDLAALKAYIHALRADRNGSVGDPAKQ
jgi:hypothetical protein